LGKHNEKESCLWDFGGKPVAGTIFAGCIGKEEIKGVEKPLPDFMKGYELYSWQEKNELYFTLITGTNRLKSYEEIISREDIVSDDGVKITVRGVDSIKATLGRLPKNESIFWTARRILGFSLPSGEIIDEIKKYCDQLGSVGLKIGSYWIEENSANSIFGFTQVIASPKLSATHRLETYS
jgi:hypothetical protein